MKDAGGGAGAGIRAEFVTTTSTFETLYDMLLGSLPESGEIFQVKLLGARSAVWEIIFNEECQSFLADFPARSASRSALALRHGRSMLLSFVTLACLLVPLLRHKYRNY